MANPKSILSDHLSDCVERPPHYFELVCVCVCAIVRHGVLCVFVRKCVFVVQYVPLFVCIKSLLTDEV